jgi:acyl-CoA hydrolase
MSQVDTAGTIPAIRRAFGWVVTVAVNSFVFKQPVFVGDLVSFYADILKIGRTSITVSVEVYAQRGAREGGNEVCIKVTEAVLTYVTVDNQHIPSGSIIKNIILTHADTNCHWSYPRFIDDLDSHFRSRRSLSCQQPQCFLVFFYRHSQNIFRQFRRRSLFVPSLFF